MAFALSFIAVQGIVLGLMVDLDDGVRDLFAFGRGLTLVAWVAFIAIAVSDRILDRVHMLELIGEAGRGE
ncbi:hypothetical protein BC739_001234 [Kutzneria viridogrisea]|uniref:Uncharacterized protein n=1 Tax=Kutzneria viridogrisea TaxID=47990 RepID=A0ABR6BBE7_9PSEU|nr:hypothetical protein [Kutzneria viridogrisea]